MKNSKIVCFIVVLILLGITVCADGYIPLVYQYIDPEVTVVFSEPLDSTKRQQNIADEIAGIEHNPLIEPGNESPDNIICTLFGHNLSPEVTVTATHHKVNKYNPRCLMEIYHVTYCTRCDYTVSTLEDSFFILCCPED